MHITLNGARLYVDIDGAGLVPDGQAMREKPTLILLYGGPGADHSLYKPGFSALADAAQIVYYDHRGNGCSTGDDPADWTLAQWADDLKTLCDTLSIVKPVVLGVSFGGFVAQAYATRYPDHPGKLILASTAAHMDFAKVYAAFATLGGPEAEAAARAYWGTPTVESRARSREICVPLYTVAGRGAAPDWLHRIQRRDDVAIHFNGPANEQGRMDFRGSLANVRCPVLLMAGAQDPITPMPFAEEIAHHVRPDLLQFERFDACGRGIFPDQPARAYATVREVLQNS
ncbi:alpha/beta fold hydrolase [Actibacterium sp. 188UL27-1]|uniref:alpha/beta fold hydrolase n=1 Tax=Actibacterium sp. 188UL27-1 TaxID=2786961 RepID=UPI00195A214F|nr:alpha/beta hydrolase [Actibacterium sp. 188UL27-1]MBM7067956.1 alpha/beta hydrolase [Actibacterium sp. 188UL27-1]